MALPWTLVEANLTATVADRLHAGRLHMGSALVGVIGTLLGVAIGAAAQQVQASRNRNWQQADLLKTTKRGIYAEYLRSISASYARPCLAIGAVRRTPAFWLRPLRSKSSVAGKFPGPPGILRTP